MSRPIWSLPWAANHTRAKLKIVSPAAMAKLAIDRASLESLDSCKRSGDVHSKSGDREIFIILSKIGRFPAKSGDLEALQSYTISSLLHCLSNLFLNE